MINVSFSFKYTSKYYNKSLLVPCTFLTSGVREGTCFPACTLSLDSIAATWRNHISVGKSTSEHSLKNQFQPELALAAVDTSSILEEREKR